MINFSGLWPDEGWSRIKSGMTGECEPAYDKVPTGEMEFWVGEGKRKRNKL